MIRTNRQNVGASQREDGEHLNYVLVQYPLPGTKRSAYQSTGEKDGLPISLKEEISAWVYLAYSVNCGQKFEQLVVVCD